MKGLVIFSSAIISLAACSSGQPTSADPAQSTAAPAALAGSNKKITYNVPFDVLEGCETGQGKCDPVTITRSSLSDSVVLIFPSGGTQSDVFLYDVNEKDKSAFSQPKPIRQDQRFAGEGKPSLDLTGLPDGKYRSQMVACGLGGGFDLVIATSR